MEQSKLWEPALMWIGGQAQRTETTFGRMRQDRRRMVWGLRVLEGVKQIKRELDLIHSDLKN